MIARGELLEWAVVHGRHRYGTPRAPVVAALGQGKQALLEIDLQGARQVRQNWPSASFVFLAPPSWEELRPPPGRSGHRDAGAARAPAGHGADRAGGGVGVRPRGRERAK